MVDRKLSHMPVIVCIYVSIYIYVCIRPYTRELAYMEEFMDSTRYVGRLDYLAMDMLDL